MFKGIDAVDKAIIEMLQRDSRASYAEIGRRVGRPESTVRYRVGKLLERGVIIRFTVLVRPEKIGLPVTSVVMIKSSPDRMEEIFEKISSMREALHVMQSTGEYDILTVLHTRDIGHLNSIENDLRSTPGIKDVVVRVATGKLKIEYDLEPQITSD